MDRCKVHAWSANECATMADYKGSLLTLKLGTMQSKRQCSFTCHVICNTHCILLACVPFPALRATLIVAILQAPDGIDSG